MQLTVSVEAARAALGVGKTKFYELINGGHVRTIRAGRRRLVTVSSLQAFVEGGES